VSKIDDFLKGMDEMKGVGLKFQVNDEDISNDPKKIEIIKTLMYLMLGASLEGALRRTRPRNKLVEEVMDELYGKHEHVLSKLSKKELFMFSLDVGGATEQKSQKAMRLMEMLEKNERGGAKE